MATFEVTTRDQKIQDLLQGDRGMAALLEPILNQLLQVEMNEHLRAELGERTDQRRGWRNGSYQRRLTTRVGVLCALCAERHEEWPVGSALSHDGGVLRVEGVSRTRRGSATGSRLNLRPGRMPSTHKK